MCVVKSPPPQPLSPETEAELQQRLEAWRRRSPDVGQAERRRRLEVLRRRALGIAVPIEGDKRP